MDIEAIRTALKDAIKTVNDLRVEDLRDDPHPPCAIVYPKAPFPFDATNDGTSIPEFCVLILVPYVNTTSAQTRLGDFLSDEGDTSIKVAIESDQTLGGVVSDCIVTDLESYGVISLSDGGTRYLSAELVVRIWT